MGALDRFNDVGYSDRKPTDSVVRDQHPHVHRDDSQHNREGSLDRGRGEEIPAAELMSKFI